MFLNLRNDVCCIVRLTTKVIYITFAKAKSHINIKPCERAFIDRAIKPDELQTFMLLGKNETVIDYDKGEVYNVTLVSKIILYC